LYIASGLSLFTTLVHIFAGGKSVAKPLLKSALSAEPKFTNYYCWHMVSIVLLSISIVFYLAARAYVSLDLSQYITVLVFLFSLWSIILTVWKKQKFLVLPQWILFLPIAVCGYMGSW
jgi:hypothetical protein